MVHRAVCSFVGSVVASAMRKWTGTSSTARDAPLNACLTFINIHIDSLTEMLTSGTASRPLLM